MKIPPDFLLKLNNSFKNAWTEEFIDGKICYCLRNPVYCQAFWVGLWYHYLADEFRRQNYIELIRNTDLTLPVFMTENFEIINAEPVLENIVYYAELQNSPIRPPVEVPFKMLTIYITFVITFILLVIGMAFYDNYKEKKDRQLRAIPQIICY